MRMSTAALLVLCVVVCGGMPNRGFDHPGSSSCTYWCKTRTNRFYCCDDGLPTTSRRPPTSGSCPPVRPVCPKRTLGFHGPTPCRGDHNCAFGDKCCFDVCLQLRVCKPAQHPHLG